MTHDDDEAIFRVDTVPPPPGEDDAYSAATKVGALANAVMREKMIATRREIVESRSSSNRVVAAEPAPVAAPPPAEEPNASADEAPLPQIYDDVDDDVMRAHGALITPPNVNQFMEVRPEPVPSAMQRVALFVLVAAFIGIGVLIFDLLRAFAVP